MRQLYHSWFSPNSRKIQMAMLEKELDFELVLELPWKRRYEFLVLNPAGTVPFLIEDDGSTICGNYTLSEYLDEKYQSRNLTGTDIQTRAEVRRLTEWFDISVDSPYMLMVSNINKDKTIEMNEDQKKLFGIDLLNIRRSEVPAVTHVDYSARIQTVNKNTNFI